MEHLLELVKTASESRLSDVQMITIDLPPVRIKSKPQGEKKNPHNYRTRITMAQTMAGLIFIIFPLCSSVQFFIQIRKNARKNGFAQNNIY